MNNGHHNAIFGSNPDVDDNLNKENWQRSLEISVPADLPTPEALQEKANDFFDSEYAATDFPNNLSSEPLENQAVIENRSLENPTNPQEEFGQIVSINQPKTRSQNLPKGPQKYNPINIKTTGDRLEKSTIPEIDNIITELNQTGNLSNFYDEIRGSDEKPGMMEVNLENSYGRKIGEAN